MYMYIFKSTKLKINIIRLEQRLENLETCHDYGAAAAEGTKHHGDIKERINEVIIHVHYCIHSGVV